MGDALDPESQRYSKPFIPGSLRPESAHVRRGATSHAIKPADPSSAHDQIVTPWDVQGSVSTDGQQLAIDYDKLIDQFGTRRVDAALLERFERLTGHRPHILLRRGMFFSHRDFNTILDRYEKGNRPSSDSMHLGHMILLRWLQDVFDVPLVIQLTVLFKHELKPEQTHEFALKNARDIIAVGFSSKRQVSKISRQITLSQAKATFGFGDSDNIGKIHFAAIQAAPSFSNSFPHIFGTTSDIPCLIPCAIDQDPYSKLKYPKPTLLHANIYMSDTLNQIKNKINRHGFSGGRETEEEHRRLGGNPDVDVSYQYLSFFLDDDEELAQIGEDYRAGRLLTGQLKARCIKVLQDFTGAFQARRKAITDEEVKAFMDANRQIVPTSGKYAHPV
ncbi:hypothetical protein EI94DRAFT_1772958 [Lactarius quietus]|nr:hypothetical protein EI94DRAFT_1772958 [Lactarius quietus]